MSGAISNEYWGLVDERLVQMAASTKRVYFRSMIWERDRGLCGICGGPVQYAEMDLDHVKPKSLGGPDHWDNLRVAHATCNRARGNGQPVAAQPRAPRRGRGRRTAPQSATLLPLELWRRRRLLTQDGLAAKAGIFKATIARIESGARVGVRFKTMKALADALGVQPAEVDEFRPRLGLDA